MVCIVNNGDPCSFDPLFESKLVIPLTKFHLGWFVVVTSTKIFNGRYQEPFVDFDVFDQTEFRIPLLWCLTSLPRPPSVRPFENVVRWSTNVRTYVRNIYYIVTRMYTYVHRIIVGGEIHVNRPLDSFLLRWGGWWAILKWRDLGRGIGECQLLSTLVHF